MADTRLKRKDVSAFLVYVLIAVLCVAALLYILLNAKPRITPKVKGSGGPSLLVLPPKPSTNPATQPAQSPSPTPSPRRPSAITAA